MPKAQQVPSKLAAAARNGAISFVNELDSTELMTGAATITVLPAGPTLSSKAVNTAGLTIDGTTVAAGQALQFHVTGGDAGVTYVVTASANTDATPAQTLVGQVEFRVR